MNGLTIGSPLQARYVPFYYQIVELFRRKIEQGELTPGEKLPPEIELSKSFGVSRVTLRQALSILKADGLLDRKQGNGTFVAKSLAGPETIKLTGIIEQNPSGEQAHRLISVEDMPPLPTWRNSSVFPGRTASPGSGACGWWTTRPFAIPSISCRRNWPKR